MLNRDPGFPEVPKLEAPKLEVPKLADVATGNPGLSKNDLNMFLSISEAGLDLASSERSSLKLSPLAAFAFNQLTTSLNLSCS